MPHAARDGRGRQGDGDGDRGRTGGRQWQCAVSELRSCTRLVGIVTLGAILVTSFLLAMVILIARLDPALSNGWGG